MYNKILPHITKDQAITNRKCSIPQANISSQTLPTVGRRSGVVSGNSNVVAELAIDFYSAALAAFERAQW